MMNRLTKIQLLKDISAGRKAVSDLQPETVEMWLKRDGNYHEPFKRWELTEEEFEAHKANYRNRIMFVPDERFVFY